MEIVIKIDEEIYNYMQTEETDEHLDKRFNHQTRFAIKHGIPLPKGHGRLMDETEAMGLIAEGKTSNKAYFGTVNKDWEVIDFLKTVPTIIEADTKSGTKKKDKHQENKSKQLIDELSKMPPMVIATAYLQAVNLVEYGEDVTQKWVTAIQNTSALEKAYQKGYYNALQRQADSEVQDEDSN